MKCIICSNSNKKSKCFVLAEETVKAQSNKFYDEIGRYHEHNSNVTFIHYRCSNGHSFKNKQINRCWCGWNWKGENVEHVCESNESIR